MSKIDDILATMPEDTIPGMTDEVIVIDPTTRQMSIPGSELIFGVESDAHSERKYFIAPRVVGDNVDLASSFIRVNYRNGNGEMDFSLVDDVTIIDDKVLFSWKLSGKVTQYRGMVAFLVYAVGQDGVAWHTTLASGLVLEGLEPDIDGAVAQTEDAVVALINMVNNQTVAVDNAGVQQITAILNEGANQVNAVKTTAEAEKSAAMAEIEAKGANTLANIPDDYTALSEAVEGLVVGHAPGIVCEAEGSAISISDASDNPIKNLRIFGKSTQDGVPSPDAPMEIKSIVNPTVSVDEQTITISRTLPGIPVTSGGNYTDSNGQQWICDEVDLERGVYVRRIATRSFDGTEKWAGSTSDSLEQYHRSVSDMVPGVTAGYCNRLRVQNSYTVAGKPYARFSGQAIWWEDNSGSFGSLDAFKAYLVEQHESGNPLTIVYPLATPIETPLSETEIAAYRALHSNYPNTTVLNDAGAHMAVEYVADTKTYIDNKITALVSGV